MIDLEFVFDATIWASPGPGAWHFVSLPDKVAEEIRFFRNKHFGFGTIRVQAFIGDTKWKTSLFPDKASNSFFLPIKSEVRKKEKVGVGDVVSVRLIMDL